MKRLVEFESDTAEAILVEVEDLPGTVVTRGGGAGAEVFVRAQRSFEDAVGRIRPAVQGVIDQMLSFTHRPDEVSVQFGIDLHAEAGAFVAAVGSDANFNVTLTWKATPAVVEEPTRNAPASEADLPPINDPRS
jgi:NTP-dependent ternary system trypsin peptidase co-occuring protein